MSDQNEPKWADAYGEPYCVVCRDWHGGVCVEGWGDSAIEVPPDTGPQNWARFTDGEHP